MAYKLLSEYTFSFFQHFKNVFLSKTYGSGIIQPLGQLFHLFLETVNANQPFF